MNITKKEVSLDWKCQRGQMSLGTFAPVVGQLPAGSSAFLVPVSLSEFLPGPRVGFCNCWCVVFGMFVGGCFLFGFCYLPFVVVALASSLAAQVFCGFQAKRLETVPRQRAL